MVEEVLAVLLIGISRLQLQLQTRNLILTILAAALPVSKGDFSGIDLKSWCGTHITDMVE